jgi:hypothetical protein
MIPSGDMCSYQTPRRFVIALFMRLKPQNVWVRIVWGLKSLDNFREYDDTELICNFTWYTAKVGIF